MDDTVKAGDRVNVEFPVTLPTGKQTKRLYGGCVVSVNDPDKTFVVDFDDGDTFVVHNKSTWTKAPTNKAPTKKASCSVAVVTTQTVQDAMKGADVRVLNTASRRKTTASWTKLSDLSAPYLRLWTARAKEEFVVWAKNKRTRVRVACGDRMSFDALCKYLERNRRRTGLGHW